MPGAPPSGPQMCASPREPHPPPRASFPGPSARSLAPSPFDPSFPSGSPARGTILKFMCSDEEGHTMWVGGLAWTWAACRVPEKSRSRQLRAGGKLRPLWATQLSAKVSHYPPRWASLGFFFSFTFTPRACDRRVSRDPARATESSAGSPSPRGPTPRSEPQGGSRSVLPGSRRRGAICEVATFLGGEGEVDCSTCFWSFCVASRSCRKIVYLKQELPILLGS